MTTLPLTLIIEDCHDEAAHTTTESCTCIGTYSFKASIIAPDSGRHGTPDQWYPPEGGVDDVYDFLRNGTAIDPPAWLTEAATEAAATHEPDDDREYDDFDEAHSDYDGRYSL